LTEGKPDPRAVARQVGFKDHRELAEYCEQKGYVWSSEEGNYVELAGEITEELINETEPKWEGKVVNLPSAGLSEQADLTSYLPLLQILERNKERLLELVDASVRGRNCASLRGTRNSAKQVCLHGGCLE